MSVQPIIDALTQMQTTLGQIIQALPGLVQAPAPAPQPPANPFGGAPTPAPTPAPAPAAVDPFGAPAAAAAPQVTAAMIQELITPLTANEAVKAELTKAMQAMGISQLADTQPHQMNELYARFQQVAGQAAQIAQAAAPAAAPSLI